MNDTVMKAHQNRNMTYDEMHDYECSMEWRTLREATYCLYIWYLKDITVPMLIKRKLASRYIPTRLDHAWHLPIVVGTPFDQSGQFG